MLKIGRFISFLPTDSAEEPKKEIEEYIEWYNAERLHSSLDYMSPIDYEKSVTMVA